MSFSSTFLPEFEQEMQPTRKLIERYPDSKGTWKPHQKSFSLAHLTQLVAWMPGWITNTIKETSLDLHRGQLTVYLRLVDVPIPSIYGPTADEGFGR